MYRNQYDYDVAMFSPQGRIHQIEFAMEAVKQGSASVGIKNKDYVVLAALKRHSGDLSAYQKKISEIDSHILVSVSGFIADAKTLSTFMRKKCYESTFLYKTPVNSLKLVTDLVEKMHGPTMNYGERPFGVGMLVASCDDNGNQLYEICPSANFISCKAMAIGSRSQSCKTYLSQKLDLFEGCSLDELITHALIALTKSLPQGDTLNSKNVSIGIVGRNVRCVTLDDDKVERYLSLMPADGGQASTADLDQSIPMEQS